MPHIIEDIGGSPFLNKGNTAAVGVYDYVFTGAGCAGLSLLMHLKEAGLLSGKKVLVIDRDAKQANDRTWCFWEQGTGFFEPIVYKSWKHLSFYSNSFSGSLQIEPYQYKLIRGIDFYNYCFTQLRQLPQLEWLQAEVESVKAAASGAVVMAGGNRFRTRYVFNSIIKDRPSLQPHQYWLLQHFKGWIVETEQDCFDPEKATLMDLRVGQEHGCTFAYVLPFSSRRALVEYTLFSKSLLPAPVYDAALQSYLTHHLGIQNYSVKETEFGTIPMTNFAFPKREKGAVCNIGTAGGNTKASSGYTFRFIQKHAVRIVASLQQDGHPFTAVAEAARFKLYDSLLLHILQHGQLEGAQIFSRLFRQNKAVTVLKFLDNETSPAEELRLMGSLPFFTFSRAAIQYMRARLQKR